MPLAKSTIWLLFAGFNGLLFIGRYICALNVMELTLCFGDWFSSYYISQCEGRGSGRERDKVKGKGTG